MAFLALIAFLTTALLSPIWMRVARKLGIMGVDVHKEEEPAIPEMGGVAIFSGYALGSLGAFLTTDDARVLVSLLSIGFVFLIGVIDDIKNLAQINKFSASFLAGIPLLFFPHDTIISFLFFKVDFGAMYYVFILIGMVAASNATNLLAGFNGEEAGCGIIAIFSLLMASFFLRSDIVSLILSPMLGALLAFYLFNRYPSSLFCGDCGSLIIGASIATSVIFGKIEILGAIAIMPAIAEFFFKLPKRFSGRTHGATQIHGGILRPPPYLSVANLLTFRFRLTEKKLVYAIFLIQGFFGLLVVILSIAKASGHLQ